MAGRSVVSTRRSVRTSTYIYIHLSLDTNTAAETRTSIVREIMDTEASYVKGLAFIIDYFVLPLRLLSETEEPVLSKEEIDELFGNVEEIREKNATLLRRLEERMTAWNVDSTIGDVFVQLVSI